MRRDDLSLFRVPAFRRLWTARTISVLGSAVTPVALAFGVLDLPGAGPKDLGLVLTLESAASLVTILLGGVLGDRFPRTRMLMVSEAIAGLSVGAIAVLFILGTATVPIVAALGFLGGAAAGLVFPILAGLVPETAPEDRLQSANAFMRLSQATSQIVGFAVAGLLVASIGSGWTLTIDAISFFVAVAIVAGIPAKARERGPVSHVFRELREGWRSFRSFDWIWGTTLAATIWVAAFQASFGVLGPVVAKAELGGARGWSIVLAGFSLGGVLGTFVVARIRPRRPMVLAALLFQGGTLFTLMLAVPFSVPMMALAGAVLGVTFSVITVLWDTLLQVHVPPELLARVYSYDFLGSTAAIPIGTAIIGTLASSYGAREVLIGSAVLQGLSGVLPLVIRGVWKVGLEKPEGRATPSDGTGRSAADASR